MFCPGLFSRLLAWNQALTRWQAKETRSKLDRASIASCRSLATLRGDDQVKERNGEWCAHAAGCRNGAPERWQGK